jgi:uncharacterized protein YlxW (UPF0749 family)
MIVASLFGVPAGLEVHRIAIGEESQIKFEDSWVDISPDDVVLSGDQNIFRIFRLNVAGKVLTWVGLYRAATEIGPNRGGGFYGAGLWLIDAKVSAQTVYEVIVSLADQIRDLALKNGKFVKKISDIRSAIIPPPQVAQLVSSREKLTGGVTLKDKDGEQAFIADPQNVLAIIDWAQSGASAGFYKQVIIASENHFVSQQRQYSKGFELFSSVAVAADAAYQASISQALSKEQDLTKLHTAILSGQEQLAKQTNEIKQCREELRRSQIKEASLNETVAGLRRQVDTLGQSRMPVGMTDGATANQNIGMGSYKPGSQNFQNNPAVANLANKHESGRYASFLASKWFIHLVWMLIFIASSFAANYLWQYFPRAKKAVAELEQRPSLATYQKLEEAKNGLVTEVNELKVKLSSKESKNEEQANSDEVNSSDLFDPKCVQSLDLVERSYSIVTKDVSKKVTRADIYKSFADKCKFKTESSECVGTFEKIRKNFLDEKTMVGKLFAPNKCALNLTHKNFEFILK